MVLTISIKLTFCTFLSLSDNNFIFSVSILIITIQLCVFFNPRMPSEYYCPRCQSENVIVYDEHIECTDCRLTFFLEDIESDMDEENILAREELHGITKAFGKEDLRKIFENDDF